MKILHVVNSLDAGGAEKLIVDAVPLYQERGIDVDVLSLDAHVTVFRKALEENTKGAIFGLTLNSVYNPILILKIIPYLRRYDLIHAHLFPVLYWVVLAKLFSFSKIKIVYTEHNTNNKRRGSKVFRLLDRFIYSQLNFVGCITEATRKNLQRHLRIDSLDIKTIENGIDLQKFVEAKPVAYNYFNQEDFVLIQVSSFRPQKDQATLIEALKFLPAKIKLLLVGDGVLKDKCENLVKELKLEDRVRFLGIRTDIPSLLKYADVSIQSSNYEGFGLVSVEAMAVGKPCLVSDVDGLKQVVENYGILFERGNSKDLAKNVMMLYSDIKLYGEISQRCLSRASDFEIRKMVDKYITVYQTLLRRHHK